MNNREGNHLFLYKDTIFITKCSLGYLSNRISGSCGNLQSGVFSAIKKYREEDYYDRSNGYAIIRFFEINPKATCFNP